MEGNGNDNDNFGDGGGRYFSQRHVKLFHIDRLVIILLFNFLQETYFSFIFFNSFTCLLYLLITNSFIVYFLIYISYRVGFLMMALMTCRNI